jgi:hypothetical protein
LLGTAVQALKEEQDKVQDPTLWATVAAKVVVDAATAMTVKD